MADGCTVLLEGKTNAGTMPVLTLKRNGAAQAALFTVPPQLVRADELHERLGYGRESISRFVNGAAQTVMGMLARPSVSVSGGRLIAYRSTNGADVIIVENPDQAQAKVVDVTIRREFDGQPEVFPCGRGLVVLGKDEGLTRLRVRLPKEECAVIVIQ